MYGKGIVNTSLRIEDGKIAFIGNSEEEGLVTLGKEFYVVPGFVDKHIHGARHSDFMNPTFEDLKNITGAISLEGTTSCLATTMTQSEENIQKSLQNISSYMAQNPRGPEILGVHLEGPFVSKQNAGAQPLEYIIPCDISTFERLNEASQNQIKQVTLACEENGIALTKYLSERNIVASIGHSNSDYATIREAIENGATSVTHMYNAMRPLHHRDIGVVGAALLESELSCELICDLIHVSPAAIQLLHQNKGKDKICLITDSIESKYMPDGTYALGGQPVYVQNAEARLKDGTLAGSTLKMNQAVKNYQQTCHLSMTEAIDAASINPAKNIGVADRKGSIEIGKDADLVVIDKDYNIYMTICRGDVFYSKF